jgi:hypothetical protein
MAKTAPEETPIKLVDNIGAGDVFVDAFVGAFLTNGNVHITLASRRCDYTQQPSVFSDVVIGRLVMPLAAAENAAQFLTDFVERMKKQLANPPADAPKTLQ